jgi:hypothetical protein
MKFDDAFASALAPAGGIEISTDPDRLDTDMVHQFLSRHTDWAAGIPRGTLERSIHNSLVFGAYTADGPSPMSPTCSWFRNVGVRGWASGCSRRS